MDFRSAFFQKHLTERVGGIPYIIFEKNYQNKAAGRTRTDIFPSWQEGVLPIKLPQPPLKEQGSFTHTWGCGSANARGKAYIL